LTTTLTFGPISPSGDVVIKLIYDHRVLDGAYIARRLRDIESTLNGEILNELIADRPLTPEAATLVGPIRPDPAAPLPGPHSPSEALEPCNESAEP
jgi:hypothetical protein